MMFDRIVRLNVAEVGLSLFPTKDGDLLSRRRRKDNRRQESVRQTAVFHSVSRRQELTRYPALVPLQGPQCLAGCL